MTKREVPAESHITHYDIVTELASRRGSSTMIVVLRVNTCIYVENWLGYCLHACRDTHMYIHIYICVEREAFIQAIACIIAYICIYIYMWRETERNK